LAQQRHVLTHHHHLVVGRRSSALLFSTKANEAETFLTGTTSLYAEQMYDQYVENPDSVHPSWKHYFENMESGVSFKAEDYSRPTTILSRRAVAVVSLKYWWWLVEAL
jgi:2-oxoglutarate dehydrogenase E1 component